MAAGASLEASRAALPDDARRQMDRRRLGRTPFCLISDDCWGTNVYRHLGRRYNTPFVGLLVQPKPYLRLLGDIERYLAEPLAFRDAPGRSDIGEYPIGVLGDVEVHFVHYETRDHAATTWARRVARVDLDHLAVKIRCQSPPLLERFNALPFDRKVAFSNTAGLDAIHVPDWNWDTALERTLARFDLVEWLKQPGSAVARRGVRAYLRSLWTR